jgi:hemoglobin
MERRKTMRIPFKTFLLSLLTLSLVVALGAGTTAIGADNKSSKETSGSKTLYDRLGGRDAIVVVIDDFIGLVGGDDRINSFFADVVADPQRLARLKRNLVDFVCLATGGPCEYTGLSMRKVHHGLGIGNAEFDALVEDLGGALDNNGVGEQEINDLFALLAPLRSQIVKQE